MTKIDGASDLFDDVSPYQYGLNNPLSYIDPSGDTTININDLSKIWSSFDPSKDDVQLDEFVVTGKRTADTQQATVTSIPIYYSPFRQGPTPTTLPPMVGRAGAVGAAFWLGWQMGPTVARHHEKQVEGIAQLMEWFGTPSEFLRGPANRYSKGGKQRIWPGQYGYPPNPAKVDWSKSDAELANEISNQVGDTKRGPNSANNEAKKWFNEKRTGKRYK